MSQAVGAQGEGLAAESPAEGLALRATDSLARVPPERPAAAPAPAPAPRAAPMTAQAQELHPRPPGPPVELLGLDRSAWVMAGAAFAATVGWLVERRQRVRLEQAKDSLMWVSRDKPRPARLERTPVNLDALLPESSANDEAARAIYVTAITETTSRREATLADLHQLQSKVQRRRERGDRPGAALLLQQHLVDFRFTSPWVFLELRELYRELGHQAEWEVAREAFRQRFGQNAPGWDAASTAGSELAEDKQLARELARSWPYREARVFFLRWMLGEPEMRLRSMGPPLLGLGVYRDMMQLDLLLDEVLVRRG